MTTMRTSTITVFRCLPLRNAEMTRSGCGSRYDALNTAKTKASHQPKMLGSECVGCAVGKAHAAGDRPERWPDGAPIVFADKAVEIPKAAAKPVISAVPDRVPMPEATPQVVRRPGSPEKGAEPVEATHGAPTPEERPTHTQGATTPRDATERTIAVQNVDGYLEYPRTDPAATPVVSTDSTGGIGASRITVDGVSRTIAEWAALGGMSVSGIKQRIRGGMTPEQACTAPRAPGGRRMKNAPPEPRTLMASVDDQIVGRHVSAVIVDDPADAERIVGVAQGPEHTTDLLHDLGSVKHEALLDAAPDLVVFEGEVHASATEPRLPDVGAVPEIDALMDHVASSLRATMRNGAVLGPAALLRAAGFEVTIAGRVPAGVVLIVPDAKVDG